VKGDAAFIPAAIIMNEEEQLLTVEQVANIMQVHVETVRVWIRNGDLVAVDIGKEYRVTRADLNKYIEERKTSRRKKQTP
jgi:excisionase family DNA binding protein